MATGFLYLYFISILYPLYICVFQYCNVQLFCKVKLLVKMFCQFIVVLSIQMIAFVLKLFWKGFQCFSDVNAVMYQVLLGVKKIGAISEKKLIPKNKLATTFKQDPPVFSRNCIQFHKYIFLFFLQNMWVISTPSEFLQTLGYVGHLTVSLYLFIKRNCR